MVMYPQVEILRSNSVVPLSKQSFNNVPAILLRDGTVAAGFNNLTYSEREINEINFPSHHLALDTTLTVECGL
jgi:hypothetical protein